MQCTYSVDDSAKFFPSVTGTRLYKQRKIHIQADFSAYQKQFYIGFQSIFSGPKKFVRKEAFRLISILLWTGYTIFAIISLLFPIFW
jgi:hypothetical protein